jgi:hypothetical protein
MKSSFLGRNAPQKRWFEMVQEHMALDLSFGKDRLPAIAG